MMDINLPQILIDIEIPKIYLDENGVKNRRLIEGCDLIEDILKGKRNFQGIILQNFNLNSYKDPEKFREYLKRQDFETKPIDISYSYLMRVIANGLNLPYIKGNYINVYNSQFNSAVFTNGQFSLSKFYDSELRNSDLSHVNLEGTVFGKSDLADVNWYKTRLFSSQFWDVDIIGAKNLDKAMDLEYAHFVEVSLTEEEKKIIKRSLKKRNSFIIKDKTN